mmetsp:Transcript_46088/g.121765  ORF Transcript_46088/g.121765 Transcript_46088/m.121765 type:complete len:270 (+) Transcript_46088:112-921(+)
MGSKSTSTSTCCPGLSAVSRQGIRSGPPSTTSSERRTMLRPRFVRMSRNCFAAPPMTEVPMSRTGASYSSQVCSPFAQANSCRCLKTAASLVLSSLRLGWSASTFHCGRERISAARASLAKSAPSLSFQKWTSRYASWSATRIFFGLPSPRNWVNLFSCCSRLSPERVRLPSTFERSMGSPASEPQRAMRFRNSGYVIFVSKRSFGASGPGCTVAKIRSSSRRPTFPGQTLKSVAQSRTARKPRQRSKPRSMGAKSGTSTPFCFPISFS